MRVEFKIDTNEGIKDLNIYGYNFFELDYMPAIGDFIEICKKEYIITNRRIKIGDYGIKYIVYVRGF